MYYYFQSTLWRGCRMAAALSIIIVLLMHTPYLYSQTLCSQNTPYSANITTSDSHPTTLSSMYTTSDSVSNVRFLIQHDLIIDKDFKFKNCKFKFKPNVVVYVRGHSTDINNPLNLDVTFDGCQLFSCDYKWKGILLDSATQSFTMTDCKIDFVQNAVFNYSPSIVMKWTKIKIGIFEFYVLKPFTVPVKMSFKSNTFTDCFTGISVDKGIVDMVACEGNVFKRIERYGMSFDDWRNINVSNVMIGGNNPAKLNIFDSIGTAGIYSYNNNLNVRNTIFKNMFDSGIKTNGGRLTFRGMGKITQYNYSITNSIQATFYNCMNGINTTSTALSVRNTHFQNCFKNSIYSLQTLEGQQAILINNSFITSTAPTGTTNPAPIVAETMARNKLEITRQGVNEATWIQDNYFYLKATDSFEVRKIDESRHTIQFIGVQKASTSYNDYISNNTLDIKNKYLSGIHVGGFLNKVQVNNNNIYGPTDDNAFYAPWGISLISGDADLLKVYDNQVSSSTMHCAIHQQDMKGVKYCDNTLHCSGQDIHIIDNCERTEIHTSILKNAKYGLYLESFKVNHSTGDTLGNAMIGTQTHFGNIWNNTYSERSAVNASPVAGLSAFIVDQTKAYLMPVSPSPSSGWFIPASSDSIAQCDNLLPNLQADYVRALARGEILNEDPATRFDERVYLYRTAMSDTTLQSIPAVDSFMTNYANTTVGKIARASAALIRYITVNTYSEDVKIQNLKLDTLLASSAELDSVRYETVLTAYQEQQRRSLDSAVSNATYTLDTILGLYLATRHDSLSVLQTTVSAISTTDSFELAYKSLYTTLIQYYMSETKDSIDASKLSPMIAIAALNPVTNGFAVHIARNMVSDSLMNEYREQYAVSCLHYNPKTRSLSKMVDEKILSHELTCYPNPAGDQITILGLGDAGSLSVYDAAGRKVWSHMLIQDAEAITIPTTSFTSGTYIVRYITGERTSTVKFIK